MYMQHWLRFAGGKIVFFRGSEDTEQSAAAFSMTTFITKLDTTGHGPRVAVKDIVDIAGVPTTAGSRAVERTAQPAARDAACLAGARSADARFVGKANLHELALLPLGTNPWFGHR